MFLKKIRSTFCFSEKKMFPQQMFRSHANRETFRETCFLNNVSATTFPCLRGLKSRHRKKRCYYLFTSCTVYLWILKKVENRFRYLLSDSPACAGRFLPDDYKPKPHDNSNIMRCKTETNKIKLKLQAIKDKIAKHDDSLSLKTLVSLELD